MLYATPSSQGRGQGCSSHRGCPVQPKCPEDSNAARMLQALSIGADCGSGEPLCVRKRGSTSPHIVLCQRTTPGHGLAGERNLRKWARHSLAPCQACLLRSQGHMCVRRGPRPMERRGCCSSHNFLIQATASQNLIMSVHGEEGCRCKGRKESSPNCEGHTNAKRVPWQGVRTSAHQHKALQRDFNIGAHRHLKTRLAASAAATWAGALSRLRSLERPFPHTTPPTAPEPAAPRAATPPGAPALRAP